MKTILYLIPCVCLACGLTAQRSPMVKVVEDKAKQQVDILVDGQLFTSYIHPDEIKKPVLWPVVSPAGNELTRSYPLKDKAGERVDHPHHVGIWFNYGDVNGLDFWNNSGAIKPERAAHYGAIHHQEIKKVKSGKGKGMLVTTSAWKDHAGKTLLQETTEFHFQAMKNVRIIDRIATLSALAERVSFTDNKEGMFAIRVARGLELPGDEKLKLSDGQGNVIETAAADQPPPPGDYLSSEGITGGDVWGTRAKWMKLSGEVNGEKVAIVIYDHPDNVGYPTYWHARGYGLFAANTLGQKALSKGKEALNYSLNKEDSVNFKYRIAIFSGDPSTADIEGWAKF